MGSRKGPVALYSLLGLMGMFLVVDDLFAAFWPVILTAAGSGMAVTAIQGLRRQRRIGRHSGVSIPGVDEPL